MKLHENTIDILYIEIYTLIEHLPNTLIKLYILLHYFITTIQSPFSL